MMPRKNNDRILSDGVQELTVLCRKLNGGSSIRQPRLERRIAALEESQRAAEERTTRLEDPLQEEVVWERLETLERRLARIEQPDVEWTNHNLSAVRKAQVEDEIQELVQENPAKESYSAVKSSSWHNIDRALPTTSSVCRYISASQVPSNSSMKNSVQATNVSNHGFIKHGERVDSQNEPYPNFVNNHAHEILGNRSMEESTPLQDANIPKHTFTSSLHKQLENIVKTTRHQRINSRISQLEHILKSLGSNIEQVNTKDECTDTVINQVKPSLKFEYEGKKIVAEDYANSNPSQNFPENNTEQDVTRVEVTKSSTKKSKNLNVSSKPQKRDTTIQVENEDQKNKDEKKMENVPMEEILVKDRLQVGVVEEKTLVVVEDVAGNYLPSCTFSDESEITLRHMLQRAVTLSSLKSNGDGVAYSIEEQSWDYENNVPAHVDSNFSIYKEGKGHRKLQTISKGNIQEDTKRLRAQDSVDGEPVEEAKTRLVIVDERQPKLPQKNIPNSQKNIMNPPKNTANPDSRELHGRTSNNIEPITPGDSPASAIGLDSSFGVKHKTLENHITKLENVQKILSLRMSRLAEIQQKIQTSQDQENKTNSKFTDVENIPVEKKEEKYLPEEEKRKRPALEMQKSTEPGSQRTSTPSKHCIQDEESAQRDEKFPNDTHKPESSDIACTSTPKRTIPVDVPEDSTNSLTKNIEALSNKKDQEVETSRRRDKSSTDSNTPSTSTYQRSIPISKLKVLSNFGTKDASLPSRDQGVQTREVRGLPLIGRNPYVTTSSATTNSTFPWYINIVPVPSAKPAATSVPEQQPREDNNLRERLLSHICEALERTGANVKLIYMPQYQQSLNPHSNVNTANRPPDMPLRSHNPLEQSQTLSQYHQKQRELLYESSEGKLGVYIPSSGSFPTYPVMALDIEQDVDDNENQGVSDNHRQSADSDNQEGGVSVRKKSSITWNADQVMKIPNNKNVPENRNSPTPGPAPHHSPPESQPLLADGGLNPRYASNPAPSGTTSSQDKSNARRPSITSGRRPTTHQDFPGNPLQERRATMFNRENIRFSDQVNRPKMSSKTPIQPLRRPTLMLEARDLHSTMLSDVMDAAVPSQMDKAKRRQSAMPISQTARRSSIAPNTLPSPFGPHIESIRRTVMALGPEKKSQLISELSKPSRQSLAPSASIFMRKSMSGKQNLQSLLAARLSKLLSSSSGRSPPRPPRRKRSADDGFVPSPPPSSLAADGDVLLSAQTSETFSADNIPPPMRSSLTADNAPEEPLPQLFIEMTHGPNDSISSQSSQSTHETVWINTEPKEDSTSISSYQKIEDQQPTRLSRDGAVNARLQDTPSPPLVRLEQDQRSPRNQIKKASFETRDDPRRESRDLEDRPSYAAPTHERGRPRIDGQSPYEPQVTHNGPPFKPDLYQGMVQKPLLESQELQEEVCRFKATVTPVAEPYSTPDWGSSPARMFGVPRGISVYEPEQKLQGFSQGTPFQPVPGTSEMFYPDPCPSHRILNTDVPRIETDAHRFVYPTKKELEIMDQGVGCRENVACGPSIPNTNQIILDNCACGYDGFIEGPVLGYAVSQRSKSKIQSKKIVGTSTCPRSQIGSEIRTPDFVVAPPSLPPTYPDNLGRQNRKRFESKNKISSAVPSSRPSVNHTWTNRSRTSESIGTSPLSKRSSTQTRRRPQQRDAGTLSRRAPGWDSRASGAGPASHEFF